MLICFFYFDRYTGVLVIIRAEIECAFILTASNLRLKNIATEFSKFQVLKPGDFLLIITQWIRSILQALRTKLLLRDQKQNTLQSVGI